jgi:hypothetical protein
MPRSGAFALKIKARGGAQHRETVKRPRLILEFAIASKDVKNDAISVDPVCELGLVKSDAASCLLVIHTGIVSLSRFAIGEFEIVLHRFNTALVGDRAVDREPRSQRPMTTSDRTPLSSSNTDPPRRSGARR